VNAPCASTGIGNAPETTLNLWPGKRGSPAGAQGMIWTPASCDDATVSFQEPVSIQNPVSIPALDGERRGADNARLQRAQQGRLVAGVARGVANHLHVDVLWVRFTFLVLVFFGGMGVVLYGALWIFVPVQTDEQQTSRSTSWTLLISLGAIVAGGAVVLQLAGVLPASAFPVVLVVLGAALVWSRTDDEQRQRLAGASGLRARRLGWFQVLLGAGLVIVGATVFLAARGSLTEAARVLVAAVVLAVGVGLLVAPWAVSVWRERDAERRARIRSEERAEIAAHVHDSVLQTLTLIQRSAADPNAVAKLARAQERDLRHWLYEPVPDSSTTLRGALEAATAEIEDAHGRRIDIVCVGDAPLDARLTALVAAAREAMLNAVKHGGNSTVSTYAEVAEGFVTLYVRDRGPGFDLDEIADDRRGVRDSIVGRMARHGGEATISRLEEEGQTLGMSVELRMKVTP